MALHGKNIIAGNPSANGKDTHSAVDPATGRDLPVAFLHATDAEVDEAVLAAHEATKAFAGASNNQRASLLRRMAAEIELLGDELIERSAAETGLPAGRLTSERGRTTGQLKMFADLVDEGSWVDARIDTADPGRTPAPKPDVRRMLKPIGPVAVFCASNFPLAFSVAGGDTASALAAGNAVVIKAHSSHPGTAELVATALCRAVEKESLPAGLVSLLHGPGASVGISLVRHPLIRAAGFTGSHSGGRALFDAAASRDDPIPVYAEMGSINPVFVLPGAMESRHEEIAEGLINSVTLGAGQFCTNPGLVCGIRSDALTRFASAAGAAVRKKTCDTMLNAKIQSAYIRGVEKMRGSDGVELVAESGQTGSATCGVPTLFKTDAQTYLAGEALAAEVFGPSTLIVSCADTAELLRVAGGLSGHLTATIHGTEDDLETNAELIHILERKAGRLIFNGYPTGVEVCSAMNHGGPYPATTDVHFTSVGTAAIFRFARPLCYQNFPDSQLPPELKDENPLGLLRYVNGEYTKSAVRR